MIIINIFSVIESIYFAAECLLFPFTFPNIMDSLRELGLCVMCPKYDHLSLK